MIPLMMRHTQSRRLFQQNEEVFSILFEAKLPICSGRTDRDHLNVPVFTDQRS